MLPNMSEIDRDNHPDYINKLQNKVALTMYSFGESNG